MDLRSFAAVKGAFFLKHKKVQQAFLFIIYVSECHTFCVELTPLTPRALKKIYIYNFIFLETSRLVYKQQLRPSFFLLIAEKMWKKKTYNDGKRRT